MTTDPARRLPLTRSEIAAAGAAMLLGGVSKTPAAVVVGILLAAAGDILPVAAAAARLPADPVQLAVALDTVDRRSIAERVAIVSNITIWHGTVRAIIGVLADTPGLVVRGLGTGGGRQGAAVGVPNSALPMVLMSTARIAGIRVAEAVPANPAIGRSLGARTPCSLQRNVFAGCGDPARPWTVIRR